MFIDHLVILMTVAAFLLSGYFVLTWGWGIVKAKRNGQPHVTWFGILDFAGLQAIVFIVTGLVLLSLAQGTPLPPATDWNTLLRRTLVYLLMVLVAGIRTARWIMRQNPRWARPMIRVWRGMAHRRALRELARQRRG